MTDHPIQLNCEERAEIIRATLANRPDFLDFLESLGAAEARRGRMAAIDALALDMIRDVIEDLEPRNRVAEIGAILDAASLVNAEQGPPPAGEPA